MLTRYIAAQSAQRGVGMVEVLVSVLLLAIGVLGFTILQVRAVSSTGEALNQTQALLILRGLADEMRVDYAQQGTAYVTAATTYVNYSSSTTAPSPTCTNTSTSTTAPTSPCTAAQLVTTDVYQAAKTAFALGMHINVLTCPVPSGGSTTRQCLYAAWGNTTPTQGTGTADCMSSTGTYNSGATCVMLEGY